MNTPQVPPQLRIWQLGLGFASTAVLHALVKTGVIERLREPKQVSELARECNLDAGVLQRTLRFATVIGAMTQDGERYALTDTGRMLLKDVPGSLYMGVLLVGTEPWQRPWQDLAYTLTTGSNSFEKAMGSTFFEYLEQHRDFGTTYNRWMTISTAQTAKAVAEAYDFAPYKTVCDIGGGQGVMLKTILADNPHLHGILFDQESVVKSHVLGDMAQRVEIEIGNFFERVPAADVLLMKNVLHDWSDEKCRTILSRCRGVMQPSSRLLILEMVIGPADLIGAFYDLHMGVTLGGKERTEDEFRSLLNGEGLKLKTIIATKSPVRIIEASL